MEIEELKIEDELYWDEFVKKSNGSTFYHQIGWKNVIEKSYKHKPIYLVAKQDGDIKGILPLFLLQSQIFGRRLISVPFGPYGGVIAVDKNTEELLLENAKNIVKDLNIDFLELRNLKKNNDLIAKETYISLNLKLDEPDILWKKFSRSVKRNINKSKKFEIIYKYENLNDFYTLYSKKMLEFGTLPHSYNFMKNILIEFPQQAAIAVVLYKEKPVAAQLYFTFKETVILVWIASLKEYMKMGTNYFLYWELMKKCYEKGYTFIDFGRSIAEKETYYSKESWGAVPQKLFYQYFTKNENQIQDTSRLNPNRQRFSKIWRKSPLIVANTIGPRLRKQFP